MKSQRVDSGHEGGTSRRPASSRSRRAVAPEPEALELALKLEENAPEGVLGDPLEPAAFCREVVSRGSVEAACEARGVSLGEYAQARLTNPAFDEAAMMADQVLDLRVVDQVRKAAQREGELASQTLYFRAVRTEASQAAFPSLLRGRPGLADAPALPPEVASAIIRAGLEAHEKLQRGGEPGKS